MSDDDKVENKDTEDDEKENAIEGTVEKEGQDVRAEVEVNRTTARWRIGAAAEWAKSKGWGVSVKGKWRF